MKNLVIALLVFTVIDVNAQEFTMTPKGTISDITVVVQNMYSDLDIQGGTAGDIKIEADDYEAIPEKAVGLRPLSALGPDNSGIGLNIIQSGNIVTISGTHRNRKNEDYRIMLPANIKLKIVHASFRSDDITVRGMTNEVEVKSQVGDLLFTNVTGPIIASTISSDIKVEFSSLNQSSPSSITSVSGNIDISLPESSKGDFTMSSISGEIYTDMEFQNEMKKGAGFPPEVISVNSKLNGGGVNVTLRSVSGDIFIRKGKSAGASGRND